MQIPYLPLRGSKFPRFIGGSIGHGMEIFKTSALPIPMVPRSPQSNGYIKRKLRAWRVQKCIALLGADTVLTSAWKQSVPFYGGQYIGPGMEICEISALPIHMVPRFHQSNGYIKRKLRAWRLQKCIALLGADTILTTARPQTTPFLGGYKAQSGNMRKFVPTLPHGTALAPK